MKYEFNIDKIYTASITLDFPTDDPIEADEMAADWAAEHWEEIECKLACVQYVDADGNEANVYEV